MNNNPSTKRNPEKGAGRLSRSFCQRMAAKSPKSISAALIALAFAGGASAQNLQVAGDLIVNLQNADLVAATTNVWTNATVNPLSVGNFTLRSGTAMPLTSVPFGSGILTALNVNATGNNIVRSGAAGLAPAEIIGRGTVTVEVWAYANDLGAVSCVEQYGNAANQQNREFNYSANAGQGAVSGFNADSSWTPTGFPTAGILHHLVYQYDGTNFLTFQDGVSNTFAAHANWATVSSRIGVGGSQGGGDPFHGSIVAARVMSGLLTPAQILNNYNLGPLATYVLVPLKPVVTPTTNAFVGDTINLTELVQGTGPFTYQWLGDNGTGGVTFTPIGGATASNYVFNTAGLTPTNYQFEVADTGSITATSPPVTITVNPASKPIVSVNTTPAATSNLFVGYGVNLSATFIGNQTITYLWEVSTNGINGTYVPIDPVRFPTSTSNSVSLTNLQLTDSGYYSVQASNSFGVSNSTPVLITIQPLSALPNLQVAGTLLVQLEPQDLNTNLSVWTNEISSVLGDFTTDTATALNVTNLVYNSTPINAVAINNSTVNALVSAGQVPANITAHGPVSVEAWVIATNLANNNTIVAYGIQGQAALPEEDREFDYGANSAFSGDFGSGDTSWTTGSQTANVWHYLAWTYNGTTLRCYQDGVQNVTSTSTYVTPQTVMVIGAGIANSGPNLTDTFRGNIAAVRVEDGVLSAAQVLNNFIAGPTKSVSLVVSPATVSPSNVVFYGDSVVVAVTNAQSLRETLTYQWQADNGSGGTTWSNVTAQTGLTYSFNTVGTVAQALVASNYQYQLVVTGSLGSKATSAPVTVTVNPATKPSLLTDISPLSATFYVGQQITFTGAFSGNKPITNQWQISTNGGTTFTDISGASDTNAISTLTVTNLTTSVDYRLKASNFYGSTNSSVAVITVLPLSQHPQVQVAGEIIADLETSGIDTNNNVWHNDSVDPNSVGDFQTQAGILNVTNSSYNFQPMIVLNVNGNSANGAISQIFPPSFMLGAGSCSMEAWVNVTQTGSGNTAVQYGDGTGGSAFPEEERALNYHSQPYGAFTADFGNADVPWTPVPTANVWHYIVVTYDGSTVRTYQDGAVGNTATGVTLLTEVSSGFSFLTVGCGSGGTPGNALSGLIASARVESGVLTPSQVAQNFAAGPTQGLTVAQLAPLNSSFSGGQLTLNWIAGTLQSAPTPKGPWTNVDNAAAGTPFTVTPNPAVSGLFYRLQY